MAALICFSLIFSNVEHLSMCLLSTCLPPLQKMSGSVFCPLGLFPFLLLRGTGCLYVVEVKPCPWMFNRLVCGARPRGLCFPLCEICLVRVAEWIPWTHRAYLPFHRAFIQRQRSRGRKTKEQAGQHRGGGGQKQPKQSPPLLHRSVPGAVGEGNWVSR